VFSWDKVGRNDQYEYHGDIDDILVIYWVIIYPMILLRENDERIKTEYLILDLLGISWGFLMGYKVGRSWNWRNVSFIGINNGFSS